MTDKEIAEAIGYCTILWPHSAQPAGVDASLIIKVWRRLLGDLVNEHVVAAIDAFAAEGERFAPGPGVLRRKAREIAQPFGGAPTAGEAWQEVLSEISRVGRYANDENPTKFSHPAVAETVAEFGWQYLCGSEDQMADRAHFMKFYVAKVEKSSVDRALPQSVLQLEQRDVPMVGTQLAELEAGS